MKVLISLLILFVFAQANSKECIDHCIQAACGHEHDQHQCLTHLASEVKCLQDKCDPQYEAACVHGCCQSHACQSLFQCVAKCPEDQLSKLYPKFYSKNRQFFVYDLTKDKDHYFKQVKEGNKTVNGTTTKLSSNLLQAAFVILGLAFISC